MMPELARRGWMGRSGPVLLGPALRLLREAPHLIVPNRGWVTVMLTLVTVASVVWSVESAEWVATPSLMKIASLGVVTGLVLAKIRFPGLILQAVAMLVGFATIVWYGPQLIEAGSWGFRLSELWERLGLWSAAAFNNGISTDPMPFGLVLIILSWLLGYLCGWYIFRHRGLWIPLLLTGFAIMTNLSYLPDRLFGFFVTYLLFATLLAAWMRIQRREQGWTVKRIAHSPYLGAATLHHAFWFALFAIIVSFLLPIRQGNVPVVKTGYEYLRLPVEQFHNDFNRLFAGLPARKPLPFRVFGDALPFQGRIRLSDEAIFSVTTSRASYLRVRSYATYTSKGWVSANTQVVSPDWEPTASLPTTYEARQEVTQQVTLNFGTATLMVAGMANDANIGLEVEVPTAPSYTISLNTSSQPLPEDINALAQTLLARAERQRDTLTEADVHQILPADLHLVKVDTDDEGVVAKVTVERPLPVPLDILSVRSTRRLFSDARYRVSSFVSVATPEELRDAGEEYPAWVQDIYLNLPDSLPARVRALAQRQTAQAENPYDKALAVQAYLRSLRYTLDMPPVPFAGDGVDHLLFTVGGGYSDYFASGMAVMLRAVGVPSRLAAGYTPGEKQDDGSYVVRDRNSHAWTEVFFPGYGWVEFEPTPGRPPIVHGRETPLELESGGGFGEEFLEEEEEDPFFAFSLPTGGAGRGGFGSFLVLGAYAGIGLMVLGGSAYLGFSWLLGLPATPAKAYVKMSRLSRLAGLGPRQGQTVHEFGRSLGHRLRGNHSEIAAIVDGYGKSRYGGKSLSDAERTSAFEAWRTIRLPLLARILRRSKRDG